MRVKWPCSVTKIVRLCEAESALNHGIIAVLGAANTQEDLSLNSKVDDRFGVPEQTGLTIGNAETPVDSENEAYINGNTATINTDCTTRGVDAQFPHELPDDAVHQRSDLEDNPLWRCVRSDMERDYTVDSITGYSATGAARSHELSTLYGERPLWDFS